MAISVAQTAIGSRESSGGKSELVEQVDELVQKKKKLEDELTWVKTEAYIEQEARNQLHLTKPNEVVVVYPAESAVLAQTISFADQPSQAEASSWGYSDEWIKLFGFGD